MSKFNSIQISEIFTPGGTPGGAPGGAPGGGPGGTSLPDCASVPSPVGASVRREVTSCDTSVFSSSESDSSLSILAC